MLERTIDRLPQLRLDADDDGVYFTGLGIRMVTKLPVLFEPTEPRNTEHDRDAPSRRSVPPHA